MEIEGHPGLIKTINDDEEVDNFSEESDEEIEVIEIDFFVIFLVALILYSYEITVYFILFEYLMLFAY